MSQPPPRDRASAPLTLLISPYSQLAASFADLFCTDPAISHLLLSSCPQIAQ